MKTEELNLDNPIFVFYINVSGFSISMAEDQIQKIQKQFDIYKNATIWILTTNGETRIECIYDGWGRTHNDELNKLITNINERFDILSKSNNFEDFKINIRDWRLLNILKR
jgi:hypothetical protein